MKRIKARSKSNKNKITKNFLTYDLENLEI